MSTSIESSNDLSDPNISNKIELFIQQNENITIPSIIFEYISKESIDFESNDLKNFYLQFGEIENFEVKGKISIVLFKTFFAANVCKEFLQNENNFKNDMKKDFIVRWFNLETDFNLISNENKQLYQNISNKNSVHLKKNNINMAINVNMNINMNNINNMNVNLMRNNQILSNNLNRNNNLNNYQNMMNIAAMNNLNILSNNTPNRNINMQNLYYNNMIHGMNGFNNNNNNNNNNGNNNNNNNNINQNLNGNIMNHKLNNHNNNINNNNNNNNINNNNNNNNMNINNEEKNYGKFTCKYEILIPNDKDFQIARRLIGSKGYNMKKIIDECKKIDINNNNNNDIVKLRLRGRGSGYKEGPQNKESDEPLHLCISAKNIEGMKKACELVNDLLSKIYEDYKKHCLKNGTTPLPQIGVKIDNGNSLRKNSFSK